MDDSRSRNYSKQVIKHTAIPRQLSSSSDLKQKIARRRERNENQENLMANHMSYSSSKLQNFKKPSTPKHFMSSRKKILVERNDLGFYGTTTTHVSKNPILDSKPPNSSYKVPPNLESNGLISSQITPISSKTTNSDEEPHYDQNTNCSSPKQDFLSSNPNGRVNILKRKRNELKQQRPEQKSKPSGSRIGFNEKPNTNNGSSEHESEAEIEEKEEAEKNGRSWILHQVFKFLVLLGFVGFSAFYISSMNALNPPLQSTVKHGFKILWKFLFKLNTVVDDLFTLFHLFRFHNRMHKYT
ncbi:hypothetical protein C5167_021082 [Papaver somniferum]|uniref:Uncharacterized protein n=1 Tax=Papaver somniferum TaxID=3469 RepID=A0A4Y7IYS7_PAPSO|nr:uncharacterized protein LOC113354455 [Papaver somniferum]RZC52658.1 hypothetical protein C5167_021082 [Papaver somniferum]